MKFLRLLMFGTVMLIGKQEPCWPMDPYEFILSWHCGYVARDAACTKGWTS
jgi:hypothetical protein